MCKPKKKRSLPQDPGSANSSVKAQKTGSARGIVRNQGTKCGICNKVITDQSATHPGEDAILCEGECSCWMHRSCAGLSSPLFAAMSSSSKLFLCIYCVLSKQVSEINELKTMVKNLTTTLDSFSSMAKVHPKDSQSSNSLASGNIRASNQTSTIPNSAMSTNVVKPQSNSSSMNDRKYNLIVFGIAEPPSGSSYFSRSVKDTDSVTSLFEKINPGFCATTVRDCFRLGHYKKDMARPRPILVKLNRVVDVANILSKKPNYPTEINIKPDLMKEERICESKLLAERWKLMQSGIDKKLIKIKRPSIYVQGRPYGRIQDSTFCLVEKSSTQSDTDSDSFSGQSHNTDVPPGASVNNI